jgi:hypothetical protein
MRLALAPSAPTVLGIPATLLGMLPAWWLIALLGASAASAVGPTVVTQIIRLRLSRQITRSRDARGILEYHHGHRRREERPPASE